ncbi:MAG: hypothetical protein IT292_01085 [Deltaproteobacteria bacterium]|nr:hypothetical protein [Deltaproteobacteria bacterium]
MNKGFVLIYCLLCLLLMEFLVISTERLLKRQFLYVQAIKQGTISELKDLNKLALLTEEKQAINQVPYNSYRSNLVQGKSANNKIYFISHQKDSFRKPSYAALGAGPSMTKCAVSDNSTPFQLISLTCKSSQLTLKQSAFFYGNLITNYLSIGHNTEKQLTIVVIGDLTVGKLLRIENANNSLIEIIVAGSIDIKSFDTIKSHHLQILIHSSNATINIDSLISDALLCRQNNSDANALSLEAFRGVTISGIAQNTIPLGCTFPKAKSYWPTMSFLGYSDFSQ